MPINQLTAEGFGMLSGISGGGGFDPDAQAFITALGADATISEYINTMFLGFKGEGTTNGTNFYSKLRAVYPMSPSDASTISDATAKWNAVNPLDTDAAFRLTFFNSPIFSIANGLEQNGSGNAYANTHFVESSNMVAGNNGLTVAQKNEPDFPSCYSAGDQTILSIRKAGTNYFVYSASQSISTGVGPNGIITVTRRSATDMEAYYNGVSVGTNTTSSTTQSAADLFLLGVNGGAGIPADFAEGDIDFSAIHDGLTDNEAQDLFDVITTWRTNLGR